MTTTSLVRPPPTSTLFPYTTLFRSQSAHPSNQRQPGPTRLIGRRGRRYGHWHQRHVAEQRQGGVDASDHTVDQDRKSTRLNSSHRCITYAVFRMKKKTNWT